MTPMEKIRKLRESGSFHFTKSLGQNFLTDENILDKLVQAAGITPKDAVIEIGPGAGIVTEKLLQAAGPVLAVEIDKALIPFLQETLQPYPNFTLWHQDVLKAPLGQWIQENSPDQPVKIVANLPYYVTTPIVMKLLEENLPIHSMVLMVQKEVALRMAAKPGTKDYGALSVAVQLYCQVEKAFDVSPNVFIPKPKVGSAVVKLTIHEKPPVQLDHPELFFTLVKAAFGQRRKTLSNALSHLRPKEEKQEIVQVLEAASIDPVRRGETLNIQEFANLSQLWQKQFFHDTMEAHKKVGKGGAEMINQERLSNLLKELVEIDSPSQREGAVAKVIREKLENLGFEVKEDDAGKKLDGEVGNLIATLKGTTKGDTIGFSAHMDTVQPGEGIKAIVEDGIMKSAGDTILGSDDKAGIAAFLEAVQTIQENHIAHGDIQAIFTIWEEGGLNGSKNMDYSLVKADKVFVMDSGGPIGSIINQGPAQDKIAATFKGKAAHAGAEPEAGISAIQIAARAIDNMKLLRIDEETTANIGNIQGGGATNIVPDKVVINAEARSLKDDKLEAQTKSMVEAMEKAAKDFGGEVEMDIKRLYTAFKLEESDPMITVLKEVFTEMGLEPVIMPSGGGSDTNHFNANGLKAVNLSVGMNKVHTVDEFIKIEDLANGARMVLEIIKKYA